MKPTTSVDNAYTYVVWGEMVNGERHTEQFNDVYEAVGAMGEGDSLYILLDFVNFMNQESSKKAKLTKQAFGLDKGADNGK